MLVLITLISPEFDQFIFSGEARGRVRIIENLFTNFVILFTFLLRFHFIHVYDFCLGNLSWFNYLVHKGYH